MFGGYKEIVLEVGKEVENIFTNVMLKNNNVNNEQLALALFFETNCYLFNLFLI